MSHVSFSWWAVVDVPTEQQIDVAAVPAPKWAEPATEQLRIARPAPVTEDEHQTALNEIDLPPHPLELTLSPWHSLAGWASATLQIALGAAFGALVVIVALAWIVQATR